MRAKMIRYIPARKGLPKYFDTYEYECIDCGRIFTRHQCNDRILPYCGICHRKYEREKLKQNKARKEQTIRNTVLDEIFEYSKGMLTAEKIGLQHKIESMRESEG